MPEDERKTWECARVTTLDAAGEVRRDTTPCRSHRLRLRLVVGEGQRNRFEPNLFSSGRSSVVPAYKPTDCSRIQVALHQDLP